MTTYASHCCFSFLGFSSFESDFEKMEEHKGDARESFVMRNRCLEVSMLVGHQNSELGRRT